jgi:hypothetical protein
VSSVYTLSQPRSSIQSRQRENEKQNALALMGAVDARAVHRLLVTIRNDGRPFWHPSTGLDLLPVLGNDNCHPGLCPAASGTLWHWPDISTTAPGEHTLATDLNAKLFTCFLASNCKMSKSCRNVNKSRLRLFAISNTRTDGSIVIAISLSPRPSRTSCLSCRNAKKN